MSIKEQIQKNRKQWYAVHCKYKCESKLAEDFKSRGIVAYVPLQTKIKALKSGNKIAQHPLIPSHIFFYIKQSEYITVLQHPHIFQFLNFSGQVQPIPEKEINLMRRIVGESCPLNIVTEDLHIGDEVIIINGELTGLRGMLTGKNNYNFVVVLESLAIGLEIYVDPQHLIKAGFANKVA